MQMMIPTPVKFTHIILNHEKQIIFLAFEEKLFYGNVLTFETIITFYYFK